ncbi:MAG TPA: glycerate kinase [Kofleriaceae bacterium]|nr:glycerate kinase [Kofleriaceae bacterium]
MTPEDDRPRGGDPAHRLGRALAEAVLRDVIAACDPARRVRDALAEPDVAAMLACPRRLALAVGKAALAMARGAGEVADGIAVVPAGGAGALPRGWRVMEAPHPVPDERSVAAGVALRALVAGAGDGDRVLALLSGGASALAELPAAGPDALAALVATVQQVMAAGAAIDEINAVRGALSAIKAGRLALASAAPVVTLAVSDVIGDPLAVIGSGPTVGPWLAAPGVPVDDGAAATWRRARQVLGRLGLAAPAALDAEPPVRQVVRRDLARVIAPMASAAHAAVAALVARGIAAGLIEAPVAGGVAAVADQLAAPADAPRVAWGEPTVRIPAVHGTGGRAQQLALELARRLRGTARGALVVGTDGIDGPPPPGRPSPAGAWVDGATWDAIAAAGIDPAAALAACDAGAALAAVGALVVIGPSGINHADLILIG